MKTSMIKIIKRADADKPSAAQRNTEAATQPEMNKGRRKLVSKVKDWIGEWQEQKQTDAEREQVIFWGAALKGLRERNA